MSATTQNHRDHEATEPDTNSQTPQTDEQDVEIEGGEARPDLRVQLQHLVNTISGSNPAVPQDAQDQNQGTNPDDRLAAGRPRGMTLDSTRAQRGSPSIEGQNRDDVPGLNEPFNNLDLGAQGRAPRIPEEEDTEMEDSQ